MPRLYKSYHSYFFKGAFVFSIIFLIFFIFLIIVFFPLRDFVQTNAGYEILEYVAIIAFIIGGIPLIFIDNLLGGVSLLDLGLYDAGYFPLPTISGFLFLVPIYLVLTIVIGGVAGLFIGVIKNKLNRNRNNL